MLRGCVGMSMLSDRGGRRLGGIRVLLRVVGLLFWLLFLVLLFDLVFDMTRMMTRMALWLWNLN